MTAVLEPSRGMRSVLRSLAVLLAVVAATLPVFAAAIPDQPERAWVVSYLCRLPTDIRRWPAEPGEDSVACEWRVYDPAEGQDVLFLRLPGTPSHISWTPAFRAVEFQVGDRLMRCEWRIGARPVELSRLPSLPAFTGLWTDSSGSRRFAEGVVPIKSEQRGANTFEFCATILWEQRSGERAWQKVASDTTICDGLPERVRRAAERFPRARSHRLATLIDSMRIGYYAHMCLKGCDGDAGEIEQTVFILPQPADTLGLEVGFTFGDSEHAMAPLVHVNRRTGRRRTIYPRGAAGLFDQIGFRERGRFLLAGTEYEGSHWRVVDLSAGKRRFLGPKGSTAAVWVLAPK